MSSTTLRELTGLDPAPAALSAATLVLIDYQNTYTTGVLELTGWREALDCAADLLARARAAGTPVVHVVNDAGPGTPYDITAGIGAIHPAVAPVDGEEVVVKRVPDAFVDTGLAELLDAAGHRDVVVAGFMTHMCVAFTAAGAFLRGHRPTVVADACATRPLGATGAEQLHRAALATVADLYGVVVRSPADLG
ncbi:MULTISPECIES: isochorismatase family protein [Kitasatospora]|uniref:Nicotinamidase-related amidase n=2 Tax=Kitasatospora TaxID=2063 RepID=A0ABT1J1J2_9ACTN|nr:isochorismatase family protein [Kitasatospora paracochleata]MCP2311286.1 nicotinamidase-related amidase [Kitasatospora paracochleata]